MCRFKNIEFYGTPDGSVMIKEDALPVRELIEKDRSFIQDFLSVIKERYPTAFSRLSELYTKNERNRSFFEYNIVHRFVRCNFGAYDQYSYDIDHIGRFHFEEVSCPLRGECRHEGIICKPRLNTNISERELEVFKLISEGFQTSDIAEQLNIAPTTVNRHRENIKAKINASSVSQMVAYWKDNNLDQTLKHHE